MFGGIGPMEIAIIAGIVLLVFGPSQIPKMGRSLGQAIKEFRNVGKELRGLHGDDTQGGA
jgi:sec-independent protein translocase protein TatA